jgi:hypothetical protein
MMVPSCDHNFNRHEHKDCWDWVNVWYSVYSKISRIYCLLDQVREHINEAECSSRSRS